MAGVKTPYTFGLAEIIVGEVLESGEMPFLEDMTKIGKVNEDSANMTMEAGDSTEIREQSNPVPVLVINQPDTIEYNFQILDATPELVEEYMGGEKVGATAVGFLGRTVTVEKSFLFKPEQGIYFAVPRASIKTTFGGDFTRTGVLTMTCVVTPLAAADGKQPVICDYLSNFETNFPPKG
ncbi:hypothetical protein SAMN05443634_105157 [Chishuiella changwenlii]|jgi:hypothetical protein|uniref:Phage tail protein n=1 Tax=Chishuiella changwenlii TaxID=1434701 RepID=A0A1M6X995_9FLAO|nr:hypothetical protein [Chishuiella changwenlii]GGF00124.1 hypothetical protein GCM10010984_17110 [Chishuiella changwenlii]SHL02355.1 hypothetical protein SAMN05443634_105157 [Chishuiella changwenlii]